VPVDFNASVRRDVQGRSIGHVLVGRPLAEIKRAYRALREAHEALKRTQAQLVHAEKMASLGRLVAGVAHELNNPISFVAGNVQTLQRYGARLQQYLGALHGGASVAQAADLRRSLRIDALLADLPSLIEGMHEGAHRTADIVAGLKRFSAMDREPMRPVDLVAIVRRAVDWVRRGNPPGFEVRVQGEAAVEVQGHPGQLMQVVMNLVQNACDATRGQDDAHLTVSLGIDAGQGQAWASFEDNGPGIAAADLPRVFEPFFTTKPVGEGTGLGLSISYGLVEAHGGRLEVDSPAGGGACFRLSLPALPASG
jgi:two-component system sensor histidine kinase HupT/HoxJ